MIPLLIGLGIILALVLVMIFADLICDKLFCYADGDFVRVLSGTLGLLPAAIFVLIWGSFAINANIQSTNQALVAEWSVKIDYLKTRKAAIENSKTDIGYDALAMAHDKEVRAFMVDIAAGKAKRADPWVSWITPYAYEAFDASCLDGLYIAVAN